MSGLVTLDDLPGPVTEPRKIRRPFVGSEDVYFDVTSLNYTWGNLVAKAEAPS